MNLRSITSIIASRIGLRPKPAAPAPLLAIANATLDVAESVGQKPNAIRLQRLILIAECWSHALHGEPLQDVRPEQIFDTATLRGLHDAFRRWGVMPIDGRAAHPHPQLSAFGFPPDRDERRVRLLREVVTAYADVTTWNLGCILRERLPTLANGDRFADRHLAAAFSDRLPSNRKAA